MQVTLTEIRGMVGWYSTGKEGMGLQQEKKKKEKKKQGIANNNANGPTNKYFRILRCDIMMQHV